MPIYAIKQDQFNLIEQKNKSFDVYYGKWKENIDYAFDLLRSFF